MPSMSEVDNGKWTGGKGKMSGRICTSGWNQTPGQESSVPLENMVPSPGWPPRLHPPALASQVRAGEASMCLFPCVHCHLLTPLVESAVLCRAKETAGAQHLMEAGDDTRDTC